MELHNDVHAKLGLEQAEHFPLIFFSISPPILVGTWTKMLIHFDENKI